MHAVDMTSLDEIATGMRSLERPDWVRDIEVREDLDASGDVAVWVWIVTAEDIPDQAEAQPVLADLRMRIRQKLSRHAPGLWAYIRICSENER